MPILLPENDKLMTSAAAPFSRITTLVEPTWEAATMKVLSVLLLTILSFGCGGYNSNNGMQPSSTPNISSVSPGSVNAGSSSFVLTVTGTGFASSSVVYWNSVTVSTTYVSAQELNANITAADVATSGTIEVYVKNPGTGIYAMGVNSNTVNFTIN
jgi:hypothetical protein